MPEDDLEKIKKEISFHALCKPCRNCGECERILDIALKERREDQGKPRPCESCYL